MSRFVTPLLIAVTVFAMASLVTGAGYLVRTLPGGLPIGNALTSLGLVCAAAATIRVSHGRRWRARIAWLALIAAVAWLPVSIAWAGNLTLSFGGDRGAYWFPYTFATAALVLGSLLWALVAAAVSRDSR